MVEDRLWRPAAQRRVRNAWGYIQAQHSAWSSASAAGLSAATNLVNAYLLHGDVRAMDLGVLLDMEAIQDKARIKLRSSQEMYLRLYLESCDTLVKCVSDMGDILMRTYVKDSGGGPFVGFTKDPTIDGDTGDGGGVAVFATLPLGVFEVLAKELMAMFQKELKVKWLLASAFHDLVYPSSQATSSNSNELHFQYLDPSLRKDIRRPISPSAKESSQVNSTIGHGLVNPPSRETLEVYLTALLAEVHIDKDRIEEISRLWSEEMGVGNFGSPQR